MKRIDFALRPRPMKYQDGVAAIELAFLLLIVISVLRLGFFTVSVFWHYTMVQKAAQDAARYLASVPASQMMTPASTGAAGVLAQEIVMKEIGEIFPGSDVSIIETFCGVSTSCGGGLGTTEPPTSVRVKFSIGIYDPTGFVDTGWFGFQISADYSMRYAGN